MQQLRCEYKNAITKLGELENRIKETDQMVELRSPDMVMVATFQELHIAEQNKIKHIELRIQELEDSISRFNSPIDLNQAFNFSCNNSSFVLSPSVDSTSVQHSMSPLYL